MVRRMPWGVLLGLSVCLIGCPLAHGQFVVVSQDLSIDKSTQTADFNLTFNQAPNFYQVDSFGRPADSFQIEFSGGALAAVPGSPSVPQTTAIIRGDEIHLAHDIRVRQPTGDGGAGSGGWGPTITAVPYTLHGSTLSFAIPAADLGVSPQGHPSYSVESFDFGNLTATHSVSMIPTPAAFKGGLVGLAFAAMGAFLVRHRAKRRGGPAFV